MVAGRGWGYSSNDLVRLDLLHFCSHRITEDAGGVVQLSEHENGIRLRRIDHALTRGWGKVG